MSRKVTKREGPVDQGLLTAVSVVLGAGLVLWLTGEVAGWLHSHTWPRVTGSDMGQILVRLPRNPGDPAAAWPARVRGQLPGAATFYVIFALLLALLTSLVLWLVNGMRSVRSRVGKRMVIPGQPPGVGAPPPASWARPQLFRDLFVREPMPGRVTLGRVGGRYVAAQPLAAVIALGPTQSHKTAGLVVPSVLEWDGPVLAASAKSDLVRATVDARWQRGDVYLYDPVGVTGLERNSWSPLARCGNWHGAYRMARALMGAGARAGHGSPDADFLAHIAPTLLAPLLLAAAVSGRSMADVVRWAQRQERAEVTAALNVAGEPAAQDAVQSVWGLGEARRSQVYASVLGVVSVYADPAVREAVPATELTAERLLDGGANTAYVCAPAHEQRRLGPLFVALVQEVIDLAFERSIARGTPLDPPLMVALDDAAVSAALPHLDVLASTAASHGVQLVTTFRHLTQIQARYGEAAEAVVANHRAKVLLSGITDQPTLALVAELLGDESLRHPAPPPVPAQERPAGRGLPAPAPAGAVQPSPAEALRRIYPGHGLLLYDHLPPAYLTLRPWFREQQRRSPSPRASSGRAQLR
jgi:type IV secretion system protein VirD4